MFRTAFLPKGLGLYLFKNVSPDDRGMLKRALVIKPELVVKEPNDDETPLRLEHTYRVRIPSTGTVLYT